MDAVDARDYAPVWVLTSLLDQVCACVGGSNTVHVTISGMKRLGERMCE